MYSQFSFFNNLMYQFLAQQEKIKSRLEPVKQARWNQVPGVSECLDETRVTVLKQIDDWVDEKNPKQIFWLRGMAGTGKSTLAKTVCRHVKERCRLGGSFFCSRYYEGRRDERRIIPTLAEQLCRSVEGFGSELLKLNSLEDVGSSPLQQLQELIIDPLSRLSRSMSTIVVVIDALDECEGSKAAYSLLLALSYVAAKIPGFRAFITSRPEREILNAFEIQSLAKMTNVLPLDLVPRTEVDGDIDRFFRMRLTGMVKENNGGQHRDDGWPPPSLIKQLVSISGGLFIFAHTLCEFAAGTELSYSVVVEDYASQSPSDGNDLQALDKLYGSIISDKLDKLGGFAGRRGKRCYAVLATIIHLKAPLSVIALNTLLGFNDVFELIDRFRSILHVPDKENSKEVVRIIHASLQDLLTSSQRLSNVGLRLIYIDSSVQNWAIVERLWKLMLSNLCRNPSSVIDEENRDETLVYACRFWAEHLKLVVNETVEEKEEGTFIGIALALQDFVSKKLLNWIEALGHLRSLDLALSALLISQDWCKV
jgi:NACHT domain